jgi:hypothetical protein
MKILRALLLAALLPVQGLVVPAVPVGEAGMLAAQSLPSHGEFTEILAAVVRVPKVDYEALQRDRQLLDRYLERLGRVSPAALERASHGERLAFWINAYNACMLKRVVDHYPLRPGDAGFFGTLRNRIAGYPENSVWQIRGVFTAAHCRVAGAERSQDEIEHEIIRPRFQEPRIHFAVNCAAMSCPVLWPEAYTADRLEEQLDRAVRHFMSTPAHFRIERGPPAALTVNRVLEWYAEDFGRAEGIKRFFAGYLEGADRELVLRPGTEVRFFDYDWTLNDIPG